MRIGIDIRNLTRDLSGTSRYIFEICNELNKFNCQTIGFAPSKVNPNFKDINIFLNEVSIGQHNNFFSRFLWGEFFLKKLIVRKNIDIFWGAAHSLPRNLPNNIKKVITVFDLYSVNNPKIENFFRYIKENITLPSSITSADLIIVPSESTKNELIDFDKSSEKKIHVVKLGNFFIKKKRRNFYKGHISNILKPYLLFVGVISVRKNLHDFFFSYSKLPDYIKNQYNIVIISNSSCATKKFLAYTKKIGINNSVFLFTNVNDEELSYFYKNAELLVFPSFHEGFGLPIVEAQYFGVPVLTSNISSLPEVANQAGSIFINPYSTDSMISVLYKTLKNKNIIKKKREELLKNNNNFTWKLTALQIYRLFKSLYKKNV